MPVAASRIVEEIARDRTRGSHVLAERALDALALSKGSARELCDARPGMPLIAAAVRIAMRRGVPAARRELRSRIARMVRQSREILPAGARYLVFGGSGTVASVLRAVRAVVVDALPADVALVGADALLPGGDFLNAKGTARFVMDARRSGAAVFVVASVLKRVRKEVPVARGFERVPGRLVHAFLGENGLTYPETGTLSGVDPSWLDRGPVVARWGGGRGHPQHETRL